MRPRRIRSRWNTSKGRRWVVVAFWGVETTVAFYRDRTEAVTYYELAVDQGADAFYAETVGVCLQTDKLKPRERPRRKKESGK